MKNVFLFMWEEVFLLNKELKRWKDNFLEKFWSESLFIFDWWNFVLNRVMEAVFGWWLFSTKKMVIIYGVPIDTYSNNKILIKNSDKFVSSFENVVVPDDVLLIFVSYKPDKRLKFYKSIKDVVQVKEFKPLRMASQYKNILSEQLWSLHVSGDVMEYFLLKVWKNLYRLMQELEKIKLWCSVHWLVEITQDVIDIVVFGQVETNAFLFFDYFLTDKKKTFILWDKIRDDWVDFNQALWMLYWGLKLYILMVDANKQWVSDSKTMAKITGFHPFAVSKNMKNINIVVKKYNKIKLFYNNLIELDYSIKIGKVNSFGFWLEVKKIIAEVF